MPCCAQAAREYQRTELDPQCDRKPDQSAGYRRAAPEAATDRARNPAPEPSVRRRERMLCQYARLTHDLNFLRVMRFPVTLFWVSGDRWLASRQRGVRRRITPPARPSALGTGSKVNWSWR